MMPEEGVPGNTWPFPLKCLLTMVSERECLENTGATYALIEAERNSVANIGLNQYHSFAFFEE